MTDVCKEYGGALYILAAEENAEEAYFSQLMTIKEIFEENPQYVRLVSSPALTATEKKELLEKAFEGKTEPYIMSFMKLMIDRGYFGQIIGCIERFKHLYYQKRNIIEGSAKSAYPLNEKEKAVITKAASEKLCDGKTVILSFEVDESLIGGFYVEADGKVMDSTLKSRLSGLKEILSDPL